MVSKGLPDIGSTLSTYYDLIVNLTEQHRWYIIGVGGILVFAGIFFMLKLLVQG